jgi:hypothetical protein
MYWQNVQDLWVYTTALQAHKVMLFKVCLKAWADDLKHVFHVMALMLITSVILQCKIVYCGTRLFGTALYFGLYYTKSYWVWERENECVHACIILFYGEHVIILWYNMF